MDEIQSVCKYCFEIQRWVSFAEPATTYGVYTEINGWETDDHDSNGDITYYCSKCDEEIGHHHTEMDEMLDTEL